MTDKHDRSDPITRWRALIDALEGVTLAAPGGPEADPAEGEEVRRLISMRLAVARRNNLPAAWTRQPGIVPRLVPDTPATPAPADCAEPAPRAPRAPARSRLAWYE